MPSHVLSSPHLAVGGVGDGRGGRGGSELSARHICGLRTCDVVCYLVKSISHMMCILKLDCNTLILVLSRELNSVVKTTFSGKLLFA